jgi:hypothetical protein
MDRTELEDRLRNRRPGDAPFRRGQAAGYEPFQPEPEDALAVRDTEPEAGGTRIDRAPPHSDEPPPVTRPSWPDEQRVSPSSREPREAPPPPPVPVPAPAPTADEPFRAEAAASEPAYDEPMDASPADDDYDYPYLPRDDDGRGDRRDAFSGALPLIGFGALALMALAVGVILAGLISGPGGTGDSTPSPSVQATPLPSEQPSVAPSAAPSTAPASTAPEPSDGPVAFADGALLTIQPCATSGFRESAVGRPEEDACQVDGSSVEVGDVWGTVVFRNTPSADTLRVRLVLNGEVINERELVLGSVLTQCGTRCSGLIYGATYRGLQPGTYELVLARNGEFADRAAFVVEG